MPLPRYLSISENIRKRILSGELAANAKLPSQRDLAKEYDTTLMTIRQALTQLEEEGLTISKHGVGTFIVGRHLDDDRLNLMGFSEEMERRDFYVTTILLDKRIDILQDTAAIVLGLAANTPLAMLERIRLINEVPIIHQRSYLHPSLRSIISSFSGDRSLYDCIGIESGQVITTAREVVVTKVIQGRLASLLKCKDGTPAFFATRVSITMDGTPYIYDEATMLGPRFSILNERLGRKRSFHYHIIDQGSPSVLQLLTDKE